MECEDVTSFPCDKLNICMKLNCLKVLGFRLNRARMHDRKQPTRSQNKAPNSAGENLAWHGKKILHVSLLKQEAVVTLSNEKNLIG